jgi:hypothetical protein
VQPRTPGLEYFVEHSAATQQLLILTNLVQHHQHQHQQQQQQQHPFLCDLPVADLIVAAARGTRRGLLAWGWSIFGLVFPAMWLPTA